jgi:hypothetical protein
MASDTFWSNPGRQTPPVPMLSPQSIGDQQPNPLLHMPGTLAGAVPAAYVAAAQAVYPWAYDANEAVRPYDASFPTWHSRQQINYLAKNGDVSIPPLPSGPVTETTPRPQAYYTVSTDRSTVINLMSLTTSDYQRLSLQDRQKLETLAAFTVLVAPTLGLTTDRSGVNTKLFNIRNGENGRPSPLSALPTEDRKVFEQQLQLIERRMASSPRIAEGTVQKQIADIATRLGRAAAFASVKPQTDIRVLIEGVNGVKIENGQFTNYGAEGNFYADFRTEVRGNVISSDDNATVTSGYQSLMRMERDILTAQLRREALARTDITFSDPKNDVAQLIYQLQLLYQGEATSVSDAGTEEMSQLHRLLADYAIIQRLVNETLKAFNPKSQEEKRRFMNLGGRGDDVDTAQKIDGIGRTEDGQDTRILYYWDGRSEPIKLGDRIDRTGGYDVGPRYHWYLLGAQRSSNGTITNPLVSSDQLYQYSADGPLVPAGRIIDRFSAYRSDQTTNIPVLTGNLTKEEMRIVSMFSKDVWASGTFPQTHPIELLYNVPRAMANLTNESAADVGSLRLERRDYWDKWSTQLSDNVTLLNQKNQLKQNEIENASKEANRHFDLGTNALKKMNDMLMAIGRL